MDYRISLQGQEISFRHRQFKRSRRMRLIVHADGSMVVSTPMRTSMQRILMFIKQNQEWLLLRLAELAKSPTVTKAPSHSAREIAVYKRQALILIKNRISILNKSYGFAFAAISVRNQKSRWGSCSRKGNLSFNYRIALLPSDYADYVIAHELCHLQEFNHSPRFWALVERTIPDYRRLRKDLRSGLHANGLL